MEEEKTGNAMEDKKITNSKESSPMKKKKNGSIRAIFMHSDGADMWLMVVGFIGAVADGTVLPLVLYLTGRMFNNVGGASGSASTADMLIRNTRQVVLYLVFTACGGWVGSFLGGYCWTRTGERQATRMRTRILKAVPRQRCRPL